MWIDIFKGGKQTDNLGRTADGDALIEKALATFDPSYHEPPVVIGHPAGNAPAFGWVEQLQEIQRGGVRFLQAKFKQMAPEFSDLIRQGRFKKRSASFYPDGRLRHVGFLGAMPPAVKGLTDIPASFKDPDTDYNEYLYQEGKSMDLKEFFEGLKFWNDQNKSMAADSAESGKATGGAAAGVQPLMQFTEADLEAAKQQAAAEAAEAERRKVILEFAEKEAHSKRAARSEAIKGEVHGKVASGKIAPAWVKSGLVEFMQGLDAESEYQFAETKQSQLEWFRNFLEGLPKLVDFSEFATREKDVTGTDAAAKLGALAGKKQTENQNMSYSDALLAVQAENPDLTKEFMATLG